MEVWKHERVEIRKYSGCNRANQETLKTTLA